MLNGASPSTAGSALPFFILVFVLAIPFLILGAVTGGELMPGLPVAGLMFACPGLAALILSFREGGSAAVKALLARSFDLGRMPSKAWLAPALLTAPAIAALTFGAMRLAGRSVPDPQIELAPTLALCAIFFIAALGEELGWSGYAIDRLQSRWSALTSALAIGAVWALWHWIALLQAHRPADWIGWWTLNTLALRVILVWLYNNTGRSVFAAALCHMSANVAWQLFPIHGSYMDPRLDGVFSALAAVIIVAVWGPRTLAGRRREAPGVDSAV